MCQTGLDGSKTHIGIRRYIFYPPKGVCERRSPEGVHFSKLIQERNLTHQFQRLISAFLKSEKCFIWWVGGWVGGWVVIFYPLRFSLFSGMLTSIICLLQIWCQNLSNAFRSKVMIDLSLKFGKIKADIIVVN